MNDLHVCLTPALIPLYQVENYIVVIIDIFRATSSICYGIDNGAEAIIPVSEVEECAAYREKGFDYLLAAERNGEVVAGFCFGNFSFFFNQKKSGRQNRGAYYNQWHPCAASFAQRKEDSHWLIP